MPRNDDLNPARGCLIGMAVGAGMWAAIIGAVCAAI